MNILYRTLWPGTRSDGDGGRPASGLANLRDNPGYLAALAGLSPRAVDFGCVKILPELQRQLMLAMTRATIEGRKHDYRDLMVQAGFLTTDSDLTADELYQWQSELSYEIVVMPQPAT